MDKIKERLATYNINIQELHERVDNVKTRVDYIESRLKSNNHIYGFHIDGANSNPSTSVTYLEDAVGMTPAKMNYKTGVFDYGSWENAFFMPKPCMLKSDGTVDYYLNPNDYTLKANDGTASDVADTSYDGNVMIEWGQNGKRIYYKIIPDSNPKSATIYIADYQVDSSYVCPSFYDKNGKLKDHFYTPIYNGSLDSNSKLRSISGQKYMQSKTASAEIAYAIKNGDGWYTETYGDSILINLLLVLMGKSLDIRTVFGCGNHTGYVNDSNVEYGMTPIGSMNDKGLFWGKNASSTSDTSGVKVFGMENYWGSQWRRIGGLILDKTNGIKYKLGYGIYDGSSSSDYNLTGEGYVSSGITPSGTNGGYINEMVYNTDGSMIPKTASGSSSTYYCNGLYFNTSQVNYAVRGGRAGDGLLVGAFCVHLSAAVSRATWFFGAALSYR